METASNRRRISVALLVAILSLIAPFASAPASAAALTAATWTPTSTAPSDTGVRYTWTFKTTGAGTVSTVTFAVPTGTLGAALTAGNVFGIGAPSTISLSGTTVTYTVATPANIPGNTSILISVDGFTNTPTAGTYASSVATNIDTILATSSTVFNVNTATATVTVQRALSFSASAASVQLDLDPGATADANSGGVLFTVRTNANSGYTFSTSATPLTSTAGATIPAVSTGISSPVASGSFPANRWGYSVSGTINGAGAPVNGTLTPQGGLSSSTNYVGFTSTPQVALIQTGPTNGDTLTLVTRAKIDLNQAAGTYTSQVRYTVAATY